jgi:tRNA-2-methylthio-N6-dimethylallyladenosine synthase
VEGPSKSESSALAPGEFGQLAGRTWCDRIVLFEGPGRLIGSFLPVEIERASTVTLYGRAVTAEVMTGLAQGV